MAIRTKHMKQQQLLVNPPSIIRIVDKLIDFTTRILMKPTEKKDKNEKLLETKSASPTNFDEPITSFTLSRLMIY
ncbi:MAG: hypothetical protein ACW99A_11145 [Candidatus Kariarchaeaceae archaeon]|jgi:hypothetical protein